MTSDAGPAAAPDELILQLMLTPEGRADPYPIYRHLRETVPTHRVGFGQVSFFTRYDDCRAVLRDPHMVQPSTELPGDEERMAASAAPMLFSPRRLDTPIARHSLLRLNPPDHTRLRGLVSRGFTPRRVEALRPALETMTDDLLDEMATAGEVDVLDVLGFPLPVRIIGELVGVPAADRDQFRSLVRASAASLEPGIDDATLDASEAAAHEMEAYFRELIAQRRAESADDLTSLLVATEADADHLTEDEMIATLILIFAAGFETTTNLIGNGLLALLRHPAALAQLRADPDLVPVAIEEILRYEAPVQLDARRTTVATSIGGHELAVGDVAITLLGAANRDPAHFEDPESFRLVERATPPLSFASGIHYCLGASLARLEGQVVFAKLLDRFGSIELLNETPSWRNTLVLRGLDRLPVRVSP